MKEFRAFQHNMFNLPSIKEMYSAGADLHGLGKGFKVKVLQPFLSLGGEGARMDVQPLPPPPP